MWQEHGKLTVSTVVEELSNATRMRRMAIRHTLTIAGLLLVLVLFCVVSLMLGVNSVSLDDVFSALGGRANTIEEASVVRRIPRTLLAVLVGAALALSGTGMQAITRNPLADPGILGVTSGAALAVIIGIAFFGLANPLSYMGVATIGAALAALFVYSIGSLGRDGPTPLKLVLAGAAASAALVSLTSAIVLPRSNLAQRFEFWRVGGVGGATWESIVAVIPALSLGALILFAMARGMNSLALGDELAVGLGERVNRTRIIIAAGSVILAAAATAVAGPIGFVGLVIPHLCRLLIGPDHRWLLPVAATTGAALLVASDTIGRLIARPQEIEVGIITAIIGTPFFIWIVRRQRVREL
ncbi:iron ABC transporter permease [Lysinibacter sp. HNR]|uniref:FecCD family ABC transporter permease n=1 Tax=Lysinibacter sp. HNR TaxID=3031408 RepID=UPI00243519EC|nr:iron ABC transporter permease [Lysinibacter sp. HNR]WGD37956.1 iron ABC transporter permease [Lysinibacter sp. HNR]